jgi:hypothetical protein
MRFLAMGIKDNFLVVEYFHIYAPNKEIYD